MKILCIYCEHCRKVSSDKAECLISKTVKSFDTLWSYRECQNWKYNKTDVFRRSEK